MIFVLAVLSLLFYVFGVLLIMGVKWIRAAIGFVPGVKREKIDRTANILGVVLVAVGILLSVAGYLLLGK